MRPSSGQTGPNPLSDSCALKFSYGRQDVHLQLASWCRRVNALGEGDERDAERLEILEQRYQVPQVPSEAVQTPYNKNVEPAASGIDQQGV